MEEKESKPKKKTGKYARQKGNNYELKIIKELTDLGYEGLRSSRSESKNLDNAGIDIADPENQMDFYVQCKKTKNIPSVDLIKTCKIKKKPLVIFWNKQIDKNVNICSDGEYVIMEKSVFYKYINKK